MCASQYTREFGAMDFDDIAVDSEIGLLAKGVRAIGVTTICIAFTAMLSITTVLSAPAYAHHAATMFDHEQSVELKGVISDFQWTSPHIWIQVRIQNSAGEMEEWSVEGGVPDRLFRAGWQASSFEPGNEVSIQVHPMRDGANAGLFVGAKFADGSTLGLYR
jgi:hypothetical protein